MNVGTISIEGDLLFGHLGSFFAPFFHDDTFIHLDV